MPAVKGSPTPADAHVSLVGLTKSFGGVPAVRGLDLDVPRGSFTTLLGPSGCGKTTALRMIAGFVEPDAGTISVGGVDQTGRPPNLRGVGMVFQDYALFPHMTVAQNVAYGLKMHRVAAQQRDASVRGALELLRLSAHAERYPHELSGGQQQRVALGRVIALEPEVLLMDEPLSNLDAQLRVHLRAELKGLQRELGITTIYVTHDQEEALSMSDQLVVMDRGVVQQVGPPADVYTNPVNRFVAEFVGQANLLPATAGERRGDLLEVRVNGAGLRVRLPGSRVPARGTVGLVMVRPERVQMRPVAQPAAGDPGASAGGWQSAGEVSSSGFFGSFQRYWLTVPGAPTPWLVDVPLVAEALAPGTSVQLGVEAGAACWVW